METKKHPHGRGETVIKDSLTAQTIETPPRAWGNFNEAGINRCQDRNTPTGVGKLGAAHGAAQVRWKHLHGRGETGLICTPRTAKGETPPRAWGNFIKYSAHSYPQRNTPTGVGKL